ncbi:MAG: lactoylglutathione lyase [Burkholderiaceae bacterium]
MRFLHTMIRVTDLDATMNFFCDLMGMVEVRRVDNEKGRFTLVFLAASEDEDRGRKERAPVIELTYNWPLDNEAAEVYDGGRNFGHLAYEVEDIYSFCEKLQANGVTINRPPRDGYMAFVRSPDGISVEILQKGGARPPQEPWASMENTGSW